MLYSTLKCHTSSYVCSKTLCHAEQITLQYVLARDDGQQLVLGPERPQMVQLPADHLSGARAVPDHQLVVRDLQDRRTFVRQDLAREQVHFIVQHTIWEFDARNKKIKLTERKKSQ